MRPLQKGDWELRRLGDALPLVYGRALSAKDRISEGCSPVFGSSGQVGTHNAALTQGPAVVVGRKGSAGAVYWSQEPCWPIDTAYFVRPAEGIDLRYAYYLLRWLKLGQLDQSTAIPSLGRDTYSDVCAPFPVDVKMQRRISARIDELFAELDDGEVALTRARSELEMYRKALLKAAVTGELTADWRADNPTKETGADLLQRILAERRSRWHADPQNSGKRYKDPTPPNQADLVEIPEGWVWANLDQLTVRVTKGSSPGWQGFEYQDTGVLFVRSQNVGWGDLRLKDRVYLDPGFNEIERKAIVQSGDVLLNIVGASIGRACKADERLDGANTNQAVAGIRPVSAELSNYLVSWLVSPAGQHAVFKNVVETARANLSLEQVRAIAVPLPPSAEIAAVEMAFGMVETENADILAAVNENRALADDLRQSILAAAFRGELVA